MFNNYLKKKKNRKNLKFSAAIAIKDKNQRTSRKKDEHDRM